MKQLVSLALKYIRRQKFRTVLTFLCITLAVFIFNLLAGTAVVVRNVLLRQQYLMGGTWEVDAEPLLKACTMNGMEQNEAVKRIMDHAAVEDSFCLTDCDMYLGTGVIQPGRYSYFEFADNKGKIMKGRSAVGFSSVKGNPELVSGYMSNTSLTDILPDDTPVNSILLPTEYEKAGWKTGDTYTLTITPCVGSIPDDAPQIQKLREKYADKIAENPDTPLFQRDFGDEESEEGLGHILDQTRVSALSNAFGADNVEYFDVARGTPYSISFTVGGFADNAFGSRIGAGSFSAKVSFGTQIDLQNGLMEANRTFCEESGFNLSDDRVYEYTELKLTMNRTLSFDDAVELLYKDLGLPENEMDSVLHPSDAEKLYNTQLLSLEFRGADAIASWVTDFETRLPLLITFLVIAFLLWALMRAVIDNAFEISVQERRAQFATLRIMGASRAHIAVLVCLEALFYCLLAVPLGMIAAHLAAKLVSSQLLSVGIGMEYHPMVLLILIMTALAVAAVFFSAYSSSMWAARAYAPLEATKPAELKSNKKQTIFTKDLFGSDPETRWRKRMEKMKKREQKQYNNLKAPKKSKLFRTPFSYLWNYTMRNIRRTRKRFIISVVTMTIGVTLFSIGITTAVTAKQVVKFVDEEQMEYSGEASQSDFYMDLWQTPSDSFFREADTLFKDNSLFRKVKFVLNGTYGIDDENTANALSDAGIVCGNSPDYYMTDGAAGSWAISSDHCIRVEYILRSFYDAALAPVTHISYDDWVSSNTFMGLIPDKDSAALRFETPQQAGTDADTEYELTPNTKIKMSGVLRGTLEGKAETYMLLVPAENVTGLNLPSANKLFNNNVRIEAWVTDNVSYPEAKQQLTEFAAGYDDQFMDTYFAGTGRETLLRTIAVICAIVLLAVWLTGILTMVNTVNTSVLNRADELMMLRTVGMSKRSVRLTVLLESMIFCGIATLIGSILGLSGTFWFFVMTELNLALSPVTPMLIALAATLIVNLLIAAVAARPGLRTLNARMEEGGMMQ